MLGCHTHRGVLASCDTDVELCGLWTASVRVPSESKEKIIFAKRVALEFCSRTVKAKERKSYLDCGVYVICFGHCSTTFVSGNLLEWNIIDS